MLQSGKDAGTLSSVQQRQGEPSSSNLRLKKEHLYRYGKQKSTYASRQKDFSTNRRLADSSESQKSRVSANVHTNIVEQASNEYCCANFCVQAGSNH